MVVCDRCCEPMVRVSCWLPKKLAGEVRRLAPRGMRKNLRCIIAKALRGYAVERKRKAFDRGVRRMANDPAFLKAMNAPYPDPQGRRKRQRK